MLWGISTRQFIENQSRDLSLSGVEGVPPPFGVNGWVTAARLRMFGL
jgi:hypothetical protein